ncbi:hypothetical protein FACS189459_4900 [Bacilli bacterium]|nr:hypothetical protein FACS189459_4900 [Bacilli bacterium]
MIRIPIHMIEISKQVDAASSTLNQKLGRMPTNIEVANFLGGEKAGYTPKKISAIKKINSNIASIDNQTTTDENSDFSTFIPEDNIENPNQFATREETTEKINQSLATYLTRDEETIIRMRYGLPPFTENYSFDVVALKLDKTREAIRQIEVKALKKLRHHFQADKMQELLSSEKE